LGGKKEPGADQPCGVKGGGRDKTRKGGEYVAARKADVLFCRTGLRSDCSVGDSGNQ